jgi:death-on-curing protein
VSDSRWLDEAQVVALNEAVVARTGEGHHILNLDSLAGAVQAPLNKSYYGGETDLVVLAAVYIDHIGKAHAFEQGNKRTALLAAQAFLIENGAILDMSGDDKIYVALAIEGFIANLVTFGEMVEILARFARQLEPGEVQDIQTMLEPIPLPEHE